MQTLGTGQPDDRDVILRPWAPTRGLRDGQRHQLGAELAPKQKQGVGPSAVLKGLSPRTEASAKPPGPETGHKQVVVLGPCAFPDVVSVTTF